jgi:hypothetical protein
MYESYLAFRVWSDLSRVAQRHVSVHCANRRAAGWGRSVLQYRQEAQKEQSPIPSVKTVERGIVWGGEEEEERKYSLISLQMKPAYTGVYK